MRSKRSRAHTRTPRSSSTRRTSSTRARPACRSIESQPNLIVLRTLSKAFGFASLRVGYAVASPDVAARARAAPAAGQRLRAGGRDRAPRRSASRGSTSMDTIAERERVRAALARRRPRLPGEARQLRLRPQRRAARRSSSSSRGSSSASFADGIRITLRRPPENDVLLAALGAAARRARGPLGSRRPDERRRRRCGCRSSSTARAVARVETGIGFLDHLLTLCAFHAGFDLELLAAGDLDVDEHHTVEDVPRRARRRARARHSATARASRATARRRVPMDEAIATAAVDLVRRPHAEIELGFSTTVRRRARAVAAAARAGALRDARRRSRCTSPPPAATTITWPRRRSRRSGRRSARRAPPAATASARRRASREGRARRLRRGQPAQRLAPRSPAQVRSRS